MQIYVEVHKITKCAIYSTVIFLQVEKKKSVGEVVVDRTNYRGCQFDEHLIQCETSTDISRIMNEFVYVQNYF